jgi:hypothetical protein
VRESVERLEAEKALLEGKLYVSLRFEQQRFYNPHHHPEMPRTLQLTPEASVTHLKEKIY